MISNKYLQGIGLNDGQICLLRDALRRESRYREILLQEGVDYRAVEAVVRGTDLEEIDLSNEELLRIKVRAEWNPLSVRE